MSADQPSQAALQEAVRRLNEVTGRNAVLDYWTKPVVYLVARLIEKHEPETLLDPVIEARKVKARELCARLQPEWDKGYREGKWDDCSEIKAALAALTFAGWRPQHD